MTGMVRKWPVLLEQPVTAEDLDADGTVRDELIALEQAASHDN